MLRLSMESIVSKISPESKNNSFRVKRFTMFKSLIYRVVRQNGHCRLLDVGGTPEFWKTFATDLPAEVSVTVVNLFDDVPKCSGQFEFRRVDACDMPFADNSFDLIHSNSVIEHVGLWASQCRMASEIRLVAPR